MFCLCKNKLAFQQFRKFWTKFSRRIVVLNPFSERFNWKFLKLYNFVFQNNLIIFSRILLFPVLFWKIMSKNKIIFCDIHFNNIIPQSRINFKHSFNIFASVPSTSFVPQYPSVPSCMRSTTFSILTA